MNYQPHELYKILQLRNAVFVVEQNCVFQDADDKDEGCLHLMGFLNDDLNCLHKDSTARIYL